MAEFMNVITMSGVMVTLFFGGPGGYYPPFGPAWFWGLLWFVGKVFIFASVFVWMRGTLPRPRYDQLMDFGWKLLIPLALGWVMLLATLDVFKDAVTTAAYPASDSGYQCCNTNPTRRFTHEIHIYWKT